MSLYLTSTDPDVIAAVERNTAGRRDLHARGHAWGKERGSDIIMMSGFGAGLWVSGLPKQPEGFGQWTKPKSGTSKPFATNKDEINALKALAFQNEPVPGLPELLYSASDFDGRRYVMYPTPFVAQGAAWVAYSYRPADDSDAEKIGDQWTECLASQYYAAEEARS